VRIGLVAGEASGDTLGGAFIEAVKARVPGAQFVGVGGPKMRAAGLEAWESSEALAVMGLVEVVKHLPRLLQLRKSLRQRFLAANLDVFVGIDAPEFNLGLARQLKRGGLKCVQYVSPQVWAWRQGRVRTMHESCDLVLCLLPFEPAFYAQHGVRAQFVGHPLADQIPLEIDRSAARAKLGLAPDIPVVALLPGSRRGEVDKLGADFANAARLLANGSSRRWPATPWQESSASRSPRSRAAI
jgi:lipid-A-disaccharide synthase